MRNASETKDSFCKGCASYCPVHVDIVDGRTVSLKPVKEHPLYHGYACAKGRASPEFAYVKGRLLNSVKRQQDGSFAPVQSEQAIGEIAAIVQQTIERHGPRSVALYVGTTTLGNLPAYALSGAFIEAIHSPMLFSTMAVDQPGKYIGQALHGTWLANHANMEQADGWLAIGVNPAISMFGPPNPAHAIKRAKKRGAKIFVIDPRRTELATHADVFIQAKPGTDAAILAGLIHIILSENLQDQAFLDEHVRGLETLKQSVARFTPELVARRAGIPSDQLFAMARGFAKCKKGMSYAGTGPNMSPHGSLMEYLRLCLMTICGHWLREGDPASTTGVLIHPIPPLAQAMDPTPGWGLGEKLRVRNLTKTAFGMPTTALAEEILLDGEGQVKVLICIGGNPVAAWPDPARTRAAMEKLDLLVCLDPVVSDTAKYADYVIAPKVNYEITHSTAFIELAGATPLYPILNYLAPYGAISPPIVNPPPGSDLIEDWEFFYDLARHMGKPLTVKPIPFAFNPAEADEHAIALDMNRKPTNDELLDMLMTGSPVPFSEVRANSSAGKIFDVPQSTVLPKVAGHTGKLDLGNADMMEDMDRAFVGPPESELRDFTHRVIPRRMKDRFNSDWREHSVNGRQWAYNPAFMHPDDLAVNGLDSGDVIEIRSRHGAIKGVVEAEKAVLPGVISMSHCWGGDPGEEADVRSVGSNVGLLIDIATDYDRYSTMPRMSTIPVNIRLLEKRSSNS